LCRAHNRLHAEESFGRDHVAARVRADLRQRRRPPDEPAHANDAAELTRRALTNMGFRDVDVRRALHTILSRETPLPALTIPDLLRAALAVLT
jgi:Holliday junction resolvasome RuvABC DNA-binding subunit